MYTVAETPEFSRKAAALLSEPDIQALVAHLADHPRAGVLMPGTGGVRKLRWARDGSGKRGGVRVIYYFHSEYIPLYLLTIFGKGQKANLSKTEANELSKLVKLLIRREPLIESSVGVTDLCARRPQDRCRKQTGGLSRRRADGLRAHRSAQHIDYKAWVIPSKPAANRPQLPQTASLRCATASPLRAYWAS